MLSLSLVFPSFRPLANLEKSHSSPLFPRPSERRLFLFVLPRGFLGDFFKGKQEHDDYDPFCCLLIPAERERNSPSPSSPPLTLQPSPFDPRESGDLGNSGSVFSVLEQDFRKSRRKLQKKRGDTFPRILFRRKLCAISCRGAKLRPRDNPPLFFFPGAKGEKGLPPPPIAHI